MSASAPAPRGDPGFDINADQRGRITGSFVSILVITDLVVFLRLLSRKLARAGYWWDDLFATIAMLFSNVLPILWLCEMRNGFGRHIKVYTNSAERIAKERNFRQVFYVYEIFFNTATTFSKFSVLTFYYRIFPFRSFRVILIGLALFSTLFVVSIDLAVIFQCSPVHYAWDQIVPGTKGKCFEEETFPKAKGAINVILNFVIFVLPMPLLWRLRTTLRQKVILTFIFTLAGLVVLASIIWIAVLPNLKDPDVTWTLVTLGIWNALEPNMAVVCACITCLRPLITIMNHGVFQHPLIQTKIRSKITSQTSSWRKWGSSKGTESDGRFSHLEETDDMRPLGYRGSVREGTTAFAEPLEGGAVEMEVPQQGIGVKTDIVVTTSAKLDYYDRLF